MLYQTKNPHGGDIYAEPIALDFSANTNPFGTPEGVLDAVRESLTQLHRYPDPYCRRLVRALSEHEAVAPEWILCGNGAAELIYSWCEAVRPRRALELAPTFSEYSLGLQRVGCEVIRYVLDEKKDFLPDAGLLDAIRREKPDAVILCNPNNPTGRLIPGAILDGVLVLTKELGIRLLVDECFLDLTDCGVSLKAKLGENPHLFILRAFTKSYGMAGIRLGFGMSADPELLRAMSAAVQPWNVSGPAQAAGAAALKEGAFLARTLELVRTERVWLKEQLEGMGFRVCPSQVNFLLFRGPQGLDAALRSRGIAIRNCDNYHGLGAGWYRIAVRLPQENQALVRAIRELAEET